VEEQTTIGGKFAVRFKGLSWKGSDVIFIEVTPESGEIKYFYSISIVNNIGTDFENTIKDIFSSFSFEDIK